METGTLCPHCRASNAPDENFCAACGTSLESPPEVPAAHFCSACGAKNSSTKKESRRLADCGEPMTAKRETDSN